MKVEPLTLSRPSTLSDQGKALVVVLREEFGIPFALYDAGTGLALPGQVNSPPVPVEVHLGKSSVTVLGDGFYRLVLPLHEADGPAIAAVGVLRGFASSPGDALQEQTRLHKWLDAVAHRLRPTVGSGQRANTGSNPPGQLACQAILVFDQLLGRLRIHKDVAKNQLRILNAAADLLKIQTLVLVPRQPGHTVQVAGEPCLSTWDFRQFAALVAQNPQLQQSGLLLDARPEKSTWGLRFPQVRTLMAFSLGAHHPLGWVLAINRQTGEAGQDASPEPFRRSDLALLTPFVSLLDFHVRSTTRYRELHDLLVGLARSLTAAIDAKDAYTYGHSERVARVAVEIGRAMNLPEDQVNDIYLAGLLHDIGKIGIRDEVLGKPGALTAEEFDHIKEHVTIGYQILKDLQAIRHLLPGVLHHHERFDGKGYPMKLAGEAIPQLARVLAVADGFDAMSTSRPYRQAMPVEKAEEILRQGAGSQWDPHVIEAFFRCRDRIQQVRQRGIGESLCHALDTALGKDGSSIRPPGSLPGF